MTHVGTPQCHYGGTHVGKPQCHYGGTPQSHTWGHRSATETWGHRSATRGDASVAQAGHVGATHLVQPRHFGDVGDREGPLLIVVGHHLGLRCEQRERREPMRINGTQWDQWEPMGISGTQWETVGNQRESMGPNGTQWEEMGINGTQ